MEGTARALLPATSALPSLGMLAWLAYGVSAALVALWLWRGGRRIAVPALLWLAYAAYETLMALRVLCSGECNIRVDLLLIYPVLLIALASAVRTAVHGGVTPR